MRRITAVLTRPAGQADALPDLLDAAGIDQVDFPLIEIAPADDYHDVDRAIGAIDQFSMIFFVSPNAVDAMFRRAASLGFPLAARLAAAEPRGLGVDERPLITVVGPGSVRALAAYGVTPATHWIVAPHGAIAVACDATAAVASVPGAPSAAPRYDSEALAAAVEQVVARAAWRGATALIVRGDGGREWFADWLRAAGANVDAVTAYRRSVPRPSAAAWRRVETLLHGAPHVWLLTSSEGVRNLERLAYARFAADRAPAADSLYGRLLRAPVVVSHPRIAAAAARAGFDTIANPGAGDVNVVRAIRALFADFDPTVHDTHDRR